MNDHQKAILGVVRDACITKTAALGGEGEEVSEKAQAIADLLDGADLGCAKQNVREILSLVTGETIPGGGSSCYFGTCVVKVAEGEGEDGPTYFVSGANNGSVLGHAPDAASEYGTTLAVDGVRPATEEEVTAFFTALEGNTYVTKAHVTRALDAVMA